MTTLQKNRSGDVQAALVMQDGRDEEEPLTTHAAGWRQIVTLVACLGFFCMYSLRINMGVALVAMVNHTYVAEMANASNGGLAAKASICFRNLSSATAGDDSELNLTSLPLAGKKKEGTYNWDSATQGIILSSFFYGYIMTQFIGGVLAGKYGAKWVFGIGNVMTGVFTLLSPAAAEFGLGAFIAVRVMQGFSSGVTWPSMQAFFARWAPPSERGTLPAIAYAGSFIGTPLTFIISGVLADTVGWPWIFYVFGILCCMWFIFWVLLSSSGPENHRFISRSEQTYIVKSLRAANSGHAKPGLKDVPWKKVLTSMAVWAIVVSHFTYNWGLYVLMTILPTYFKRVQGFDIKKNGFLSALPYLVQFVVHISSGKFSDFLRVRFGMKTVHVRKIFDCLGHLLPAIFVSCVGFVGCNDAMAVFFLVLTVACTGLCGAGWFVNFLDIAPQFAGILFGVSNTFSTIPGIVGPYLAGVITEDNTIESWRTVFFIIAALYVVAAIFFLIFGQGSVQPWASSSAGESSAAATKNSPPLDEKSPRGGNFTTKI